MNQVFGSKKYYRDVQEEPAFLKRLRAGPEHSSPEVKALVSRLCGPTLGGLLDDSILMKHHGDDIMNGDFGLPDDWGGPFGQF